jgi:cytochrome P450
MANNSLPVSDIDLFTKQNLVNPYPAYRQLRDTGPAVMLRREKMVAITRFDDVRNALRNAEVFSSAQGVTYNRITSKLQAGTMIASDDPLHRQLRNIVSKPLLPGAVQALTAQIEDEAERLVDRLVARRSFDAIQDMAWHLPLTVVSHLVGVPEEARARMPAWSAAAFDSMGPLRNWRTWRGLQRSLGFIRYCLDPKLHARLAPGSWGAQLFAAYDEGTVDRDKAAGMMIDYMAPALDTTVSATGSLLWLLGTHPEQWEALRNEPALIANAVLEAVRLESPIPAFARVTTADVDVGGVTVPKGQRVLVSYASANRDERKWDQPDRFDIRRNCAGHVGFGHGTHTCMGMHLAQLEIRSLVQVLTRRVRRIEVGEPRPLINSGLRSFTHLPMNLVPA